jgi:hypothetical protein
VQSRAKAAWFYGAFDKEAEHDAVVEMVKEENKSKSLPWWRNLIDLHFIRSNRRQHATRPVSLTAKTIVDKLRI